MPNNDLVELVEGMSRIGGAFRPVLKRLEGSGRLKHVGTATSVEREGKRYVITADHVLEGLEDKLVGIDEKNSKTWLRQFSRLKSLRADVPVADIAWMEIDWPPSAAGIGTSIPFAQAATRIVEVNEPAYLAVGHPYSQSHMVDAQTAVESKLMMAQVRPASESVCRALGLDPRVHAAFSYSADPHVDLDGNAIVPWKPKGMSGGAIVATTRGRDSEDSPIMVPFVLGVLARFEQEYDTFVATRLEHLWIAKGFYVGSPVPLYTEVSGTFVRAD